MPRCKLMILGEAGVGKTSLLSLLTGEDFNPHHEETEGVDLDFLRTSNICSVTWEKKAMEGDEEYKEVAAKQLALALPDKEEPVKHKKKKQAKTPSLTSLRQHLNSLVRKYNDKNKEPVIAPQPKPRQTHTSGHFPVQHNPKPFHAPYQPLFSSSVPFNHQPIYTHNPSVAQQPMMSPVAPPATIAPPRTSTSTSTTIVPSTPTSTPRLEGKKKERTPQQQPSQPTSTDPDHVNTADIFRRAVKLKKSKSSDKQTELPLKFSSFDFAGQKHYKPMHHCFLTSRAVYVVTFNVRHLLDDQCHNECIQEVKFWVNSIHVYTDDDAKIVLVGTHRGPYLGIDGVGSLDELTLEQKKTIHETMKENFNKRCYVSKISWFENDNKDEIIAMVENSIRENGSGADVIRQKLLDLGNKHHGNKDDLPTSYLRLEQHIFEKRKQNSLISREEVERWANKEIGIDHPAVALTFFHDIGIIIDPSKSSLTALDHYNVIVLLQVNCQRYL